MIICIIGLSLIFLLLSLLTFSIIIDKRHTYYYHKKWELYNKQIESGNDFKNQTILHYYEKKCKKLKKLDFRTPYDSDMIFILLSVIISLVLVLFFASSKSQGSKDYKEYLILTQSIEYCNDNNIELDNSTLIKCIEMNKKLEKYKKDKQNPWINWFIYNDIAEVNLINLNIFKGDK